MVQCTFRDVIIDVRFQTFEGFLDEEQLSGQLDSLISDLNASFFGVKLDKSEIRKLRTGTFKKRSIHKPCLETHFTANKPHPVETLRQLSQWERT